MNPLFLISGPSGCGKTTIMRRLLDNEVISFTTRQPRVGEVPGADYHFISHDEFEQLREGGKLVEHTECNGNFYGIGYHEVNAKLNRGPAFMICDVNGMQQMRRLYPYAVAVFIWCDQMTAECHMMQRGDAPETIRKRIETFRDEIQNRVYYNYVVQNRHGYLDVAVDVVRAIVKAEIAYQGGEK